MLSGFFGSVFIVKFVAYIATKSDRGRYKQVKKWNVIHGRPLDRFTKVLFTNIHSIIALIDMCQ